MRWYQPVCPPTRARRSRTWVRASATCAGAVGLGAPLGAAQRSGVGRLGQVRAEPGALQLLGDEPPAGGGLQGEVRLLAGEPGKPAAQLHARGRAELPAAGLAGVGVDPVVGDLPAVDVEASYDGHRDLPWLPQRDLMRPACRTERRGSRSHAIYGWSIWVGVGTVCSRR